MVQRFAPVASLLCVLAFAGAAFGGNGGGPSRASSSSISPPVVVTTAAGPLAATSTSTPRYHDVITFSVSTTETTSAFVNLRCYRAGALVAEGWATFFAGGTPGVFGLYSNSWSGGAADCTADLGMFANNGKWKVLASTSFHVDP